MTLNESDQNLTDSGWFVDDKGDQLPGWETLSKASHA